MAELLLLAAAYAAGSYQGAINATHAKTAINAPAAINRPVNGFSVGP